jgi:hypothetical protein
MGTKPWDRRPWAQLADGIVLNVRVTPRSARDTIEGVEYRADGRASRRARREEGRQSSPPRPSAIRRRELKIIFQSRYGLTLPNDDAGRDDLQLFADHCGKDGHGIFADFCRFHAPWMTAEEVDEIFHRRREVHWKTDDLGEKLNLTDEERMRLKITMIGAVDCKKTQRTKRRNLKSRERKQRRREADGARPHAQSAMRTKPWLKLTPKISRPTWYRLPVEERSRILKQLETDSATAQRPASETDSATAL